MTKNSASRSAATTARLLLVLALCASGALFALYSFAASPPNGTLTDTSGPVIYTAGPFVVANVTAQANDTPICSGTGQDCDDFALTVNVTADPQKQVKVKIEWPNPAADFDLYVFDSKGTLVASSATSSDPEVAILPAAPATYTVRVAPFAPAGQSFTGTISLESTPPAPAGATGPTPRYQNYPAPSTATGADSSGEPSIGIDWNPNLKSLKHDLVNTGGVAFFTANLNYFRVSFDDCSSPAIHLWEDKSAPTETVFSLDPIGFVDKQTGRVFNSQLAGASSIMAFSSDDGETWTQSQGSGQPAGVDHQTVGGGPYNPNSVPPPPPNPLYPNAVYYASQDIATALIARSDDGGLTFGPGIPMYNLSQCSGLHGHIKVGPDGTVYVPNPSCGGAPAVVVSTDNGLTWAIRPITNATTNSQDPAVGIGAGNTLYVGYMNASGVPHAATSTDKGVTWIDRDVSQGLIKNAIFAVAAAGDDDRAAFGFLGTPTGGNYQDTANFAGVWGFYIATTLDKGQSWSLVNSTGNDPVQIGSICTGGTTCGADRNLLDFNDMAVDKEGRVLAGYADGCVAPGCTEATASAHKPPYNESRSALGSIIRQSGGPHLFAAFDPKEPVAPPAPRVDSVVRGSDGIVKVAWSTPDNGGSPLTGYNVYRKTGETGSYALLANVAQGCPACKTTYDDATATDAAAKYFYKVTASNAIGEGSFCRELTVSAPPPVQNACLLPGVLAVTDVNADGTDNDSAQNTPPDPRVNVKKLFVAEPDFGPGVNKVVFTLQVAPSTSGSAPPSSQWYIIWNRKKAAADASDRRYVAMKSDAAGAVSFDYGNFGPPLPIGGVPPPNANTPTSLGSADGGSYNVATGVITITLSNSKLDDGGLVAGESLSTLNVRTYLARPDAGQKSQNNANDITGDGIYTLRGNDACALNTPPVAALVANPAKGEAPLSVSFDASSSSDPDTGDKVASFTFDFGDGSAPVTQSSPQIQHTYNSRGSFRATVRVSDSRGALSSNTAGIVIQTNAILQNISTRENVLTGDNVTIGGFIVTGNAPRKVVLRGIGPSIKGGNGQPLPGTLQDPTLELHDANGVIAFNDNWKDSQAQEIQATGIAPSDDRESAIVRTLDPGAYTAILRGKGDTTGVALVEVYDIDASAASKLANFSTRGFVQTGDNTMIGGFIAGPATAGETKVLVRAIGPSMKSQLDNTLDDPTLELYNSSGTRFAMNDNWKDSQQNEIAATGLAPQDERESAILVSPLTPGLYTAIVRGKNGSIGNGLVELYNIP